MFPLHNNEIFTLDIGCGPGFLLENVAQLVKGTVIGIDVYKPDLSWAKARIQAHFQGKKSCATVEFIICDIAHLPFKKKSVDVVTCTSVLEHVRNLKRTIAEIENIIKERGNLIAGYPIESGLFIALIRMIRPSFMSIRDPRILGKVEFQKSPFTHKQTYKTIRKVLQEFFTTVQVCKSFHSMLPDQLSWYELVRMVPRYGRSEK
jgi:ubiquinone/menaquinone biosynthesis C-methylase UbiE